MKICIISYDFTPSIGGVATHVFNLSNALAKQGHRIAIITIRYPGQNLPFIQRTQNISVFRFLVPPISKIRGISFICQASPFLFVLSLIKRFDVIHWHNMLPDTIIAWFGVAKRKIFTNHTSQFLEIVNKKRQSQRFIMGILFLPVQKIIGPSRELAEKSAMWFRRGSDAIFYIPNGVNPESFYPPSSEEKIKNRRRISHHYSRTETDFIILCPRRLETKNGVYFFVQALSLLVKQSQTVFGVITGNDAEPAYAQLVKNTAKELGLLHNLVFAGPIPNNDMIHYYHAADIVVLPSLMEATSIAGLEAMACGVPVIGTTVGGIPELIENYKNGILVPPKDPGAIFGAMQVLLNDGGLRERLAKEARKVIVEKFSWDVVAQKTMEAYLS